MNKILVVGQIVMERQYLVDDVASVNEVSIVKKINSLASSKELNASRIMCTLNNLDYVSAVGADDDGLVALRYLKRYGISYDHVLTSNTSPTGQVVVMTDKKGASAITVFLGANDDLDVISIDYSKYDFIYTSSANPLELVYKVIDEANIKNVPILVDFPNKQKEFDLKRLKGISFVCPNRQEAEKILDKKINTIKDALLACEKLKSFTDGSVFITLDKDGCVAYEKTWNLPRYFKTEKVKVKDMTGSGDIFRGVFSSYYLKTNDFEESVNKALYIATKSCEFEGVDDSINQSIKLLKNL
jgi:ribokinase